MLFVDFFPRNQAFFTITIDDPHSDPWQFSERESGFILNKCRKENQIYIVFHENIGCIIILFWKNISVVHFFKSMHIIDLVCADYSGMFIQKQVSRAGTSNYVPQFAWDIINCPFDTCLRHNISQICLLSQCILFQYFSYKASTHHMSACRPNLLKPGVKSRMKM